MTYYTIIRGGLYLTPDSTWTTADDDAAAYDDRAEAVSVAAEHGAAVLECSTLSVVRRVWSQSRSCWADEQITDGTEWAKLRDDSVGTI